MTVYVKQITLKISVKTLIGNQPFDFSSKEDLSCETEKRSGDPMTKDELLTRFQNLLKIVNMELGPDWEKPNLQKRLGEYFEA